MSTVQLTLYNLTNTPNLSLVITQADPSVVSFSEIPAWRVVKNCPKGWSFPFEFSSDISFSITDPDGNVSPQMPIGHGQRWVVKQTDLGTTVTLDTEVLPSNDMGLSNMTQQKITAILYRNQKAMMIYHITPFMNLMFTFPAIINIALAEGPVQEGQPYPVKGPEFDLSTISAADIIVSDGGNQGYSFEMINKIPRQ